MNDDRYQRGINEEGDNMDVFLLEVATGKIERLTNNQDISESAVSFSPDSSLVAFAAPDDYTFMHNHKLYVRPVRGGAWRKLGAGFDYDLNVGWWSAFKKRIRSGSLIPFFATSRPTFATRT